MFRFDAAELRSRRQRAGISREQWAIDNERGVSTVDNWESGRILPPTCMLGALAAKLGCSVADLFTDDDPVPA